MEGEGLLFFYPVARSCLEPTEWSHFTKSHSLLYSLGYFAHICACVTRCNNKDEDCCRLESDSINMVEIYRRLWGIDCHRLQGRRAVFHIDDGGTTFLGDAGEFVPEYSSSRARRRCYWSPNIERRVKNFLRTWVILVSWYTCHLLAVHWFSCSIRSYSDFHSCQHRCSVREWWMFMKDIDRSRSLWYKMK